MNLLPPPPLRDILASALFVLLAISVSENAAAQVSTCTAPSSSGTPLVPVGADPHDIALNPANTCTQSFQFIDAFPDGGNCGRCIPDSQCTAGGGRPGGFIYLESGRRFCGNLAQCAAAGGTRDSDNANCEEIITTAHHQACYDADFSMPIAARAFSGAPGTGDCRAAAAADAEVGGACRLIDPDTADPDYGPDGFQTVIDGHCAASQNSITCTGQNLFRLQPNLLGHAQRNHTGECRNMTTCRDEFNGVPDTTNNTCRPPANAQECPADMPAFVNGECSECPEGQLPVGTNGECMLCDTAVPMNVQQGNTSCPAEGGDHFRFGDGATVSQCGSIEQCVRGELPGRLFGSIPFAGLLGSCSCNIDWDLVYCDSDGCVRSPNCGTGAVSGRDETGAVACLCEGDNQILDGNNCVCADGYANAGTAENLNCILSAAHHQACYDANFRMPIATAAFDLNANLLPAESCRAAMDDDADRAACGLINPRSTEHSAGAFGVITEGACSLNASRDCQIQGMPTRYILTPGVFGQEETSTHNVGSCVTPEDCANVFGGFAFNPVQDVELCRLPAEASECPADTPAFDGNGCVACVQGVVGSDGMCEECVPNQHVVNGVCIACGDNQVRASGEASCSCRENYADSDTTTPELTCTETPDCDAMNQELDRTRNECGGCLMGFEDPDNAEPLECVRVCVDPEERQPDGSCAAPTTARTLADCTDAQKLSSGGCVPLAEADCTSLETFENGRCVLLAPGDCPSAGCPTPPYGEYNATDCTGANWPWSMVQTADGLSELCHAPVRVLSIDPLPSSQQLRAVTDEADFCVLRGHSGEGYLRCDDASVFGTLGMPRPGDASHLVTPITSAITLTLADGAVREAMSVSVRVDDYLGVVHVSGSVIAVFDHGTEEAAITVMDPLVGTISLEAPDSTMSVTPPPASNTITPPPTTITPPTDTCGENERHDDNGVCECDASANYVNLADVGEPLNCQRCADNQKLLAGACIDLTSSDCLPAERFEGSACVLPEPGEWPTGATAPPYDGGYEHGDCTRANWPWSIVQTADGLSELCHAPVNLLATEVPSSQTLNNAGEQLDFCVLRGAESDDYVRCDDPTLFGNLGIPRAPDDLVAQTTATIIITLSDGATREAATVTATVDGYLQVVHSGGSVAAVFPPDTTEAQITMANPLVGTISLEMPDPGTMSVTPPPATNTMTPPPATNTVAPPAAGGGGGGGGGGGAAAAIIAVPVVLIGGYWLLGGFEYVDPTYNFSYSGENDTLSYRGDAGFDLNHGSLSSYVRAIQSNGDAVAYESGISYKEDFYSLNYAAYESKSVYDYDLGARLTYGEGLWSISPTADAEFHYSANTEDWTSEAGAGLTAAWTFHKWNVRAHSAFTGDLNHGLDVEFRF